MGGRWAKDAGRSLREHYVKSKGRDLAQSEFLMQMNARMQARAPKSSVAGPHAVEVLRRELEPIVLAEVRRSYPSFSPKRWSL
jgi:hypothetical protein